MEVRRDVVLARLEPDGGAVKQRLMWMRTGQQQPDSPGVAQHHGANLQQLQADRADMGIGEFAPGQGDPADRFKQYAGQGGERQPVLVRPPVVTTRAVGEQGRVAVP